MASYRLLIISNGQQPTERTAKICDKTDILATLKSLGLPLRQACRNGVCGLCRCRMRSGEISYHHRDPYALDEEEREAGLILPCIAFAAGDLELELRV